MFTIPKRKKPNFWAFFLLICVFLIGMPTLLAFTLGNNCSPDSIGLTIPETFVTPVLAFADVGSVLDLHIPPHASDNWECQDNMLELRLHNTDAFAVATLQREGWLDQHIQFKLENDVLYVFIEMDNLPPLFRIARRDDYYSIIWSNFGLQGKRIAIDPGHGGHDPGAIGYRLALLEKDVTLAISLELHDMLLAAGAEVFMTRSTDTLVETELQPGKHIRPDLWKRRNIVAAWDPDFFISIHNNSWGDRNTGGIETYYNPQSFNAELNRRAAGSIQARLVEAIGRKDRGIRYKESSDAVLQTVNYPSALAEILFISNRIEEAILAEPEFPRRAAQGLFLGISDYFSGGVYR